ncbi:O-antigen ligase family protein [Desulfatitalea alkaliphila]|uniref:O-antigen ligase family protein n=1 Tax=Desulfatitalea alkaliphila TaxID=2929485 RepID=A0AA41R2Y6_9BACT|nr:O-antigen ligase family protein [Desulfatitalea alkaliphila]MCJ8502097.1 O-antigen ligase family protein [Desulfatitalea alkaliphila]
MQETKSNNISNVNFIFYLWTFFLLCRPQDLFPIFAPFRPAMITSGLALTTVIAYYKYLPGQLLFQSSQLRKFLLLYVVMILGIPFSLYARVSFEIVLTEYIVAVLFVCIFFKLINSIERLRNVLLTCCIGSGLYFFFALREFAPGTGRLSYGTMFDPNDLAYFALGFLPINLLFLFKPNPLWVRIACLCTFSFGLLLILFTGSRGGLLGLCLSFLVLLFFTFKTLKISFKAVLIVACVLLFSFTNIDTERYLSILSFESDYNVQDETGRLGIWNIGLRALMSNPITGVGVGNFSFAVGLDRQQRGLEIARWQNAHNSIVQIGTETGFVGLILYIALSLNAVRIFIRAMKYTINDQLTKVGEMGLVGFSGMFVASMFVSQAYSLYWVFYIGFTAVMGQIIDDK